MYQTVDSLKGKKQKENVHPNEDKRLNNADLDKFIKQDKVLQEVTFSIENKTE
jgi:hypothetical protein